ncbi:MAG: chemotaxis protein CheD [bacterium]
MSAPVEVYLHPGDVYASARPTIVTTILGSCVSVCISDRASAIGGLNHYLLADQRAGDTPSTRYGPTAIETLISHVVALGASRARLVAKLFGGANVLHAFQDGVHHIGAANVDVARALLAEHNIPICAEDVGGTRGRHLTFSVTDGTVSVRKLRA